jgi:hypothetical protein
MKCIQAQWRSNFVGAVVTWLRLPSERNFAASPTYSQRPQRIAER